VRHVPFAHAADYFTEDFVRLLGQRASLEHVAIHLFHVHLDGIIELVEVVYSDGQAVAVEHLEYLLPGKSS
jgi:hypothetical protein